MEHPFRIPAEWELHACCWMAWAIHGEWKDWIDEVKNELEAVIKTIAQFEPVRLLSPPSQIADARARFSGDRVEIIEAPVDDIWMRDIAPTFALQGAQPVAIDFNFNGWGNTRVRRARPGDRLASAGPEIFGTPRVCASFVAEGGALITDGDGTLITTESCLLNPNRNPFGSTKVQKERIERALKEFGIRRVIWFKGDPDEPVTSGHIDGCAMFTALGALLAEVIDDGNLISTQRRYDVATLESSFDAVGRRLRVEKIYAPRKRHWRFKEAMFAACYLNAYVANGAVITACFGDSERDEAAKDALVLAFPGRKIDPDAAD